MTEQTCVILARQTKFLIRAPRKITPFLLLQALSASAFLTRMSFEALAATMGCIGGQSISKQALAQRFSPACEDFVRNALFAVMSSVAKFDQARNSGAFAAFRRVLVQDSTSLSLHPRLAKAFPGARNQTKTTQAGAKIQAIYDLLSETFVHFNLTAFTRNDQSASPDILDVARPGDLILRDLGYFVLEVFCKLNEQKIYFLSRWSSKVLILDDNGKPINLLKELRQTKRNSPYWDGRFS